MRDVAGFDWGDYVPFATPVTAPLREVSRELAEAHFAALTAARPERLAALAALAGRHGVSLDGDDAAARLGAWLVTALRAAGADAVEDARWSGLIADVALWLG